MSYNQTTFPDSDISFITPTWDDMNNIAFEMCKKIINDQKNSDNSNFDRIITLAKGGWPMTRSLVDFLQVPKVASVGVKFYSGINERLPEPSVYQDIPVSVAGESVLIFDDVADTGESLKYVVDYLKKKGVANITTATLFYKPHSTIIPDYYASETDTWIIFPYDVVESIDILGKKWEKAGLGREEIMARFEKLKFDKAWVDFYSKNK